MIHAADLNLISDVVPITCLFLDIGGVLLTNGWGHESRQLACEKFNLDPADMEARHHLTFEIFEIGKLTLDEYLDHVVFHEPRHFTPHEFQEFLFAQSKPYPEMIELIERLKAHYGLKIVVVSNEARELNAHRIQAFRLDRLVDSFISSCFVHLRKPDIDIHCTDELSLLVCFTTVSCSSSGS